MEREKQQKKLAMSDAVSQLVTAFTGSQAQMLPPLQQMLPLFSPQPPAILPPQLTAELPLAEGMDTGVQGVGASQSDETMGDRCGAQESGSKEPMEDAELT